MATAENPRWAMNYAFSASLTFGVRSIMASVHQRGAHFSLALAHRLRFEGQ